MADTTRKFRFGVGARDGGPGGSYWSLKTSATDQDVYVAGTNPSFVYVSLHSADHWHAKIRQPGQNHYVNHGRPAPIAPGLTRALQLSAHSSRGSLGPPLDASRPVHWVTPPSDDIAVRFNVFFEEAGVDPSSWPGRDAMHTEFVGRLPLPLGGSVCVVVDYVPWEQPPVTLRHDLTPEQVGELRTLLTRGSDPRTVIYGTDDDGTFQLLFGRAAPAASTSRLARGWAAFRRLLQSRTARRGDRSP